MTGPADEKGGTEAGGNTGPDSTISEATTKLLVSQANAFAAMTAYSFGVAGKMAGLWLEALSEAGDKAKASKEADRPAPQAKPAERLAANVEPAAPVKRPALNVVTGGKTGPAPAKKTKATSQKVAANDDLKRIPGIGPRLEKVLNERGITRFADLANMSADDLKALDASLGLDNRVIRDDWSGKAKALLEG